MTITLHTHATSLESFLNGKSEELICYPASMIVNGGIEIQVSPDKYDITFEADTTKTIVTKHKRKVL